MASEDVYAAERQLGACLSTKAKAERRLEELRAARAQIQQQIDAQEAVVERAVKAVGFAKEDITRLQAAQSFASKAAEAREEVAAAQRAAADRANRAAENLARAEAEHLAAQESLAAALTAKGD
jgi:chromosome segregation ATPase